MGMVPENERVRCSHVQKVSIDDNFVVMSNPLKVRTIGMTMKIGINPGRRPCLPSPRHGSEYSNTDVEDARTSFSILLSLSCLNLLLLVQSTTSGVTPEMGPTIAPNATHRSRDGQI